jgi:hypothetical protein
MAVAGRLQIMNCGECGMCDVMLLLIQNLPGGIQYNADNFHQSSWCRGIKIRTVHFVIACSKKKAIIIRPHHLINNLEVKCVSNWIA